MLLGSAIQFSWILKPRLGDLAIFPVYTTGIRETRSRSRILVYIHKRALSSVINLHLLREDEERDRWIGMLLLCRLNGFYSA